MFKYESCPSLQLASPLLVDSSSLPISSAGSIPGLLSSTFSSASNPFGPSVSLPLFSSPSSLPLPPSVVPGLGPFASRQPFSAPPPMATVPGVPGAFPGAPPPQAAAANQGEAWRSLGAYDWSLSSGNRRHDIRELNRLENIPANNRIFVDGKAYEVSLGETRSID